MMGIGMGDRRRGKGVEKEGRSTATAKERVKEPKQVE
jgi:hypothetical protein